MLYRRHAKIDLADDLEIPLSPLIDCVFLLLIFFLVTTMLKRKETIIPVIMPDATSTLSDTASDHVLIIGLDAIGAFLEPAGRDRFGAQAYRANPSLDDYLGALIEKEGPSVLQTPIRMDVAREAPFQKTIDALDLCKLHGFKNVSVKIREPFEEE